MRSCLSALTAWRRHMVTVVVGPAVTAICWWSGQWWWVVDVLPLSVAPWHFHMSVEKTVEILHESVRLSIRITRKPHGPSSQFLCTLPMAVARSSSDGVAVYVMHSGVFSILWTGERRRQKFPSSDSAGVYCTRTLLGRRVCKRVDVYIITLSCTWRTYALSERLLVGDVDTWLL